MTDRVPDPLPPSFVFAVIVPQVLDRFAPARSVFAPAVLDAGSPNAWETIRPEVTRSIGNCFGEVACIRVGRLIGTGLVLSCVGAIAVVLAAAASAVTVIHPFAGNWTTFNGTGQLTLDAQSTVKGKASTAHYSAAVDGAATTSCAAKATYYAGDYRVSNDSGSIAGCTDPSGHELMAWYSSDVGSQKGTVSISLNADYTAFSGSYRQVSDGTGGSYDGTFSSDFPDSGRTGVESASLRVNLQTTQITLLEADTLLATPSGAASYEFEIKRAADASWTPLVTGSSTSATFTPRVAGHLQVRVVSSGGGTREVSAPRDLEVQFPAWNDIASDDTVNSVAVASWDATLKAADPKTGVMEEGFWIRLDTCNGTYSTTKTIDGTATVPRPAPAPQPSIELGPPPADSSTAPPVHGCATYTVASFHTHTATAYWDLPKGVGPSPEDSGLATRQGIPGLVYDYLPIPGAKPPDQIPGDYPLDSPAKIWNDGPIRRTTPP